MSTHPQITNERPQSALASASTWLARTLFNLPSFTAFAEPFIQLVKPNWQTAGYRCTVVGNKTEQAEVFTLTLTAPRHFPAFRAGQYVDLSLNRDGVRYTRTFSISSAPAQLAQNGTVELTIRIQPGGAITPWMATALTAGTPIHISAAKGDFTLAQTDAATLMIAGGSGITPFRSMLQQLNHLHQTTQPSATPTTLRPITLLYFARQFLFEDELRALQKSLPNLTIHWISTSDNDAFNHTLLEKVCPDYALREHYICGPHSLIKASRDLLTNSGVPTAQVHYEYFGAEPLSLPADVLAAAKDTPIVQFAHSQQAVAHNPTQSLLELAEANELKPLHGCRRGVCHQCLCKKNSGVVYNTLTQQYSDTGPEEIQLCVSVPVTSVSIDL